MKFKALALIAMIMGRVTNTLQSVMDAVEQGSRDVKVVAVEAGIEQIDKALVQAERDHEQAQRYAADSRIILRMRQIGRPTDVESVYRKVWG